MLSAGVVIAVIGVAFFTNVWLGLPASTATTDKTVTSTINGVTITDIQTEIINSTATLTITNKTTVMQDPFTSYSTLTTTLTNTLPVTNTLTSTVTVDQTATVRVTQTQTTTQELTLSQTINQTQTVNQTVTETATETVIQTVTQGNIALFSIDSIVLNATSNSWSITMTMYPPILGGSWQVHAILEAPLMVGGTNTTASTISFYPFYPGTETEMATGIGPTPLSAGDNYCVYVDGEPDGSTVPDGYWMWSSCFNMPVS